MLCTACSMTIHPVVALDIDGTMGDYHAHFRKFAEAYFGRGLGQALLGQYDYSGEFSEWLGLTKEEYRQAKLAYRQGGMKRTMPIDTHASLLVDQLQRKGIEVWIATTRPWMRLDNIDPDTQHWLERHGIRPDGLVYGDDKYSQLLRCVQAERVIAVLEDLPEQFDEASALELPVIQRRREHALHARRYPHVNSMDEAYEYITERLEQWQSGQQVSV